ncbi:phage major capsid protein [Geomonas sp. Red69]|uniref:phage major capsid protein n=1 Tax=Geomonas diazotrophica TaxID=2843197 RepID=UPI001C10F7BF|nr:phage major capsid protein [Geomonas diazotrophica]MBU5635496.1 phage major capsid protein [Geomonas diazotrophica]
MAINLKELQHRRGRALVEARRLSEVAVRQRRGLNFLEQVQVDRALSEALDLRTQIDNEIRAGRVLKGEHFRGTDYSDAIRSVLVNGRSRVTEPEQRSLMAGADAQGGFLWMPEEWAGELVAVVTNLVRVRQLAKKYTITQANAFAAPTVESDFDDPDWTPEVGKIKDDAGFQAGCRLLTPHQLTKGVKISDALLRSTAGFAESVVIDRLGYKRGVAEEKAFLTGDGHQKALGVFTPSDKGVPVTRDVPVELGANATIPTILDALTAAKYSIKAQYWQNMEWFVHRTVLQIVATLKTVEGQYLYEASDDPNLPDLLLGRPINLSEYAPNTIASGGYLACLGDFTQGYAIADFLEPKIKILNELYAIEGQTGVILQAWTDGMPVLAEAFARVKVA